MGMVCSMNGKKKKKKKKKNRNSFLSYLFKETLCKITQKISELSNHDNQFTFLIDPKCAWALL
jgi:hypothetical protein